MTKEEYLQNKEKINKSYDDKIRLLDLTYAKENSKVKIDDIITDHIGSVKVKRMSLYRGYSFPSLIYSGPCYTKQLIPFKSGEIRGVYQTNIQEGE